MESLTDKTCRVVLQRYQLPEEIYDKLLSYNPKVYVPIKVYRLEYKFSYLVFSSMQKAKEMLNDDTQYSKYKFLTFRLDPKFSIDKVYVLLTREQIPIVVTNDPEEWIRTREEWKLCYEPLFDERCEEDDIENSTLEVDSIKYK